MKKTIFSFCFLTMFLVFPAPGNGLMAQCLSGNCENGRGELRILTRNYEGIYKGECRDYQPMGKGSFTGMLLNGSRMDSVKEEGDYRYGYCMAGTQTIYKSWHVGYAAYLDWYKQSGIPRGNVWLYPDSGYDKDAGTTKPYPQVHIQDYTQTNGKGKVVKKWKEKELVYIVGKYKGEMKNDLPDGLGEYTVNDNFKFTGRFADGVPVTVETGRKYITGDYLENRLVGKVTGYTYKDLEIQNGAITRMQIIRDDSAIYTLRQPKAVMQWIYENDDDGYYEVSSVAGDTYTGMVNDFKFNGSGERIYRNGDKIKGQFVNNLSHGTATQDTKGLTVSGLFIRGLFVRGTVVQKDSANKITHFPICISGNCNTGVGKIGYRLYQGRSNYKFYEGNIVDELPNGYGVLTEGRDSIKKTIRGTFVQGLLHGFATYEGNAGIVKSMSGSFEADTLKEGVITYTDGASFTFTREGYEKEMANNTDRTEKATFTTTVFKQRINGNGIYKTPAGALVQGWFRNNMLFEGVYADDGGNRVSIGRDIDVKNLDYYGRQVIASIKADADKKRQEAARYVVEQKRQQLYLEAGKNAANFREESVRAKCTACNGTGYIVSGYSVGSTSYVSQEYMDNSGNWRRDLKGYVPAHNVTSRTPCEACHKTGVVTITQRKYTGPAF